MRSYCEVTNISNNQRAGFLKFHLGDSALRFYLTLAEATRNDFELCLAALKRHFCNPQLTELHLMKLESLKFDSKLQTPEEFLVQVQTLALQAYPNPIPEPVEPANPADDAAEIARVANENNANAERQRFADLERERQVKKICKRAMPNWIRAKIFDKPETMTIQELCTLARRCLVFNQLCPTDDWSRSTFNEVQPGITENLVSALTKMSQTQENVENKVSEITKQFEEQRKSFQTRGNRYQNGRGRGRGNRPYRGRPNPYHNQIGNGYQPRYQNYNNQRYYGPRNFGPPQRFQTMYQMPYPNQQTTDMYQDQNQDTIDPAQVEIFSHVPVTQQAKQVCYVFGLPNHMARDCLANPNRQSKRGAQVPFNQMPKN